MQTNDKSYPLNSWPPLHQLHHDCIRTAAAAKRPPCTYVATRNKYALAHRCRRNPAVGRAHSPALLLDLADRGGCRGIALRRCNKPTGRPRGSCRERSSLRDAEGGAHHHEEERGCEVFRTTSVLASLLLLSTGSTANLEENGKKIKLTNSHIPRFKLFQLQR